MLPSTGNSFYLPLLGLLVLLSPCYTCIHYHLATNRFEQVVIDRSEARHLSSNHE